MGNAEPIRLRMLLGHCEWGFEKRKAIEKGVFGCGSLPTAVRRRRSFLILYQIFPSLPSSSSPSSTTSSPPCQPQAPTSSWSPTTSTSSTTPTAPSPFQAALNLPSTFLSSFLPLNSTHRPRNHPHRRPRSCQPNQSRCATNHAPRHRHRRPRRPNLHDRQSGLISNSAGPVTMKWIFRSCQKRRGSVRRHRYLSSATPVRARVTMMRKSKTA